MRPFGDGDDLLTLCAVCSEYLDSHVSKSSLAESLSCMNRHFNPNLQYLPTAVHIHVEKEMEGAVSSCGACLPGTYISCNHDGMSVGEQPVPQPPISPNSLVQHQLQSNCCQLTIKGKLSITNIAHGSCTPKAEACVSRLLYPTVSTQGSAS